MLEIVGSALHGRLSPCNRWGWPVQNSGGVGTYVQAVTRLTATYMPKRHNYLHRHYSHKNATAVYSDRWGHGFRYVVCVAQAQASSCTRPYRQPTGSADWQCQCPRPTSLRNLPDKSMTSTCAPPYCSSSRAARPQTIPSILPPPRQLVSPPSFSSQDPHLAHLLHSSCPRQSKKPASVCRRRRRALPAPLRRPAIVTKMLLMLRLARPFIARRPRSSPSIVPTTYLSAALSWSISSSGG